MIPWRNIDALLYVPSSSSFSVAAPGINDRNSKKPFCEQVKQKGALVGH
jgi:hypothetical protein